MNKILQHIIKTSVKANPMIYAYTTPGVQYHDGWLKIGYTERDVDTRIKEQVHTSDVKAKKEWAFEAVYKDGSGKTFTDKDFHNYLRLNGVQQQDGENNEWFFITSKDALEYFKKFQTSSDFFIDKKLDTAPYTLRDEQLDAVNKTIQYMNTHGGGEFLWNAKPRFGKTLCVYDLVKKTHAKKILIVTNRPVIANSWYKDYDKFVGRKSGYNFVSSVKDIDSEHSKNPVLNYNEYLSNANSKKGLIYFVSLQDLKGSVYFGGTYEKLREIGEIIWDILVIDEAHEGIDTSKTDTAFRHIQRNFTLHLSGTPFKALASDKFSDEAIFNWTYADEQDKKLNWKIESERENPYEILPQLNLFTYQISNIFQDESKIPFDLNEFFSVKDGKFVYDSYIDKFLNNLTDNKKFPFCDLFRNELKHTFWLLNRVESAKLLAEKLKKHKVFENYEIILAAGDGRLNDDNDNKAIEKSYKKVVEAIQNKDKTITLSVGQLTTGITIPEWTGVLILSNLQSAQLYMQAAFRAQNPCLFRKDSMRKINSYVFDFDPARSLVIYEKFANDLAPGGDSKTNIKKLLDFFPVIAEDDKGEMTELDSARVLSIPRRIRAHEIVNSGFMSDFLFVNTGRIFNASDEVIEIISKFTPVSKPSKKFLPDIRELRKIPVDDNGEVFLEDSYVDGVKEKIFGGKTFGENLTLDIENQDNLIKIFQDEAVARLVQTAKNHYGREVNKKLQENLNSEAAKKINEAFSDFYIKKAKLENENPEVLEKNFREELKTTLENFIEDAEKETVTSIEKDKFTQEKLTGEEEIKDCLRGFSRTIPAFLMAYGDEKVTLENFDKIIPDEIFSEVTGITIEEFRRLRDDAKVFASSEFNDAVKLFLNLRAELANYFDEGSTRDIFDYIPAQKTNQIFTPKNIVKEMLDDLENENPGCFDDPEKTFIDPYMKSGLFIAGIVTRLYRSEKIKKIYPDKISRLKHIFSEQVYGLAPTEIIYKIAVNFILGFDKNSEIKKFNLRKFNAAPYVKDGDFEAKLRELFDFK